MRHLLLTLTVLVLAVIVAADAVATEARTTIGDVPRTYTHFMNAQEAALCRANAAAGGLSAYFFNPAVIANLPGVSGQATMRMNMKSRDYLSQGDDSLNASDDAFLFSQVVAAKRTDMYALGFGYSTPSYRRLELDGEQDGTAYTGEFNGSLRFFEVLAAATIGMDAQGTIGIAAGIANLTEGAVEKMPDESYHREAEMDGIAGSFAIGMTFEATKRLMFGVGYRLGASIDVEGEVLSSDSRGTVTTGSGTSKTAPVAVGGVRFTPADNYVFYASYIYEGWDKATSTFAAYYDTDDRDESAGERDEFDSALATAAVGGEGTLLDGRVTVRAGFSMPVGSGPESVDEPEYRKLVPERTVGFGGTVRFSEYSVDAAYVYEQYADGDESAQVVNHGIYVTVGYEF